MPASHFERRLDSYGWIPKGSLKSKKRDFLISFQWSAFRRLEISLLNSVGYGLSTNNAVILHLVFFLSLSCGVEPLWCNLYLSLQPLCRVVLCNNLQWYIYYNDHFHPSHSWNKDEIQQDLWIFKKYNSLGGRKYSDKSCTCKYT